MGKKIIIDCSTQTQTEIELTEEEVALLQPEVSLDTQVTDINLQVAAKIRKQYDVNREFRAQRLGMLDNTCQDYLDYIAYVNECIAWGDAQKTNLNVKQSKYKEFMEIAQEEVKNDK